MRKVKMNSGSLTNIVRETLRRSGVTVSESKIDSVIKQYMIEREENPIYGEPIVNQFEEKTVTVLDDMIVGLEEMISDLEIIKLKEGDILIDETNSEEYINTIIDELDGIQIKLRRLKSL
jgi:hypothetical protein